MKRLKVSWMVAIGLLALGSAGICSFAADSAKQLFMPEKNLLLIGWDGVQWDDLQGELQKGRLPNLAGLRSRGALVHLKITDHVTCTKPGWTQICTGLEAKTTGVYSNVRFHPFPKGATLFEKLEELSDHKIFTAFMAGKAHHLGSLGPHVVWDGPTAYSTNSQEGEPWMHAKGTFDLWYGDKGRGARDVGRLLINVLNELGKENRFAIFAHFADPDENGHQFGEGTRQYKRAIVLCDTWLGKIQKCLSELGLVQNTLVVVVTDHGFDIGQKKHTNAPDAFFATNDQSHHYHDGDMMDVAPTLLQLLGAPQRTYMQLPGQPLWQ